jgi:phosphonate transport system ATP-binding protein
LTGCALTGSLLTVRGLRKRYRNGTQALAGIDLTLTGGEFAAVLGPNGSGKSTLVRCVVRLIEPDAGTVRVDDVDLATLHGARLRSARRKVAIIFQRPCLVRRRSTLDNVAAGALGRHTGIRTSLGLLPAEERAHAAELLTTVGLAPLARQRADTLSGGQAQRAAIARALAQRPRVLLADEPVASLDPDAAESTMQLLRALADNERIAVLCVLHQPDLARRYADRIVALDHGRVVLDAPVEDVSAASLRGLTR